jgi:hypothetical protein
VHEDHGADGHVAAGTPGCRPGGRGRHSRSIPAAGDPAQQQQLTAAIGQRNGRPGYRRQDTSDPITHWMNHDSCRPHTTFPQTRGCRSSLAHPAATSRQSPQRHEHSTLRSARPRCPWRPSQPGHIVSADPPGQLSTAWPTPQIAT